ncbi:MAG: hypothetical protein ABI318_18270 [Chthoniobacteraceae bacterium]
MELLSVRCNHCGAPLQIPADARFVTCMYCRSELTVQRTEGSISTEVLQRIEQKTDRMADDLGVLRIQGQLEILDREWQMKRETMLVRNRRGELVEPRGMSVLAGCAIAFFAAPIVMGIGVGSLFHNKDAGAGIVFLILAVVAISLIRMKNRSPFRAALDEYEQRRAELNQQLAAQSQGR